MLNSENRINCKKDWTDLLKEHHSLWPSWLLPKLGDDQGLAQLGCTIHVAVDPAAGKAELVLIVSRRKPGVWPDVDGAEVDVLNGMIPDKVASLQNWHFF